MITVRKIKIKIVNDNASERYDFIRNAIYAQYRGLNVAMGYLAGIFFSRGMDLKDEKFIKARKKLSGGNSIFDGIDFQTGIDTKSLVSQKVKQDFSTSIKNGLMKGERYIQNYKRNNPLMTHGRDLRFYKDGNDFYIKWVNKIVFKVVTGYKNHLELTRTLERIVDGTYSTKQSSIYFDKNNNLILNLTLDIPKNSKREYINGRYAGVDLGLSIPAYISVSDNEYIRQSIGSYKEFTNMRQKLNNMREREYKKLNTTASGKGRKKKLASLDKFKEREKNFVRTYNHFISRQIIKFAKKNKVEAIKLEKLTKDGINNRILRNWSYYQLQEMIEYKAEREGIPVLYVDAAYTSQKCSRCDHISADNRKKQSKFSCINCGYTVNADYNASRNIAMAKADLAA